MPVVRSCSWWMAQTALLLLLSAQAFGQEKEETPAESEDVVQAGREEKLPTEGKGVAVSGPTEAQEEHTVVRGDNLWDLCAKYLNNSWYWPRVWSYNPEISNPHWIYPGQKVRFFGGAGELPSEIEVGREFEIPQQVAEESGELPDRLIEMSGKIVKAKRVQAVMLRRNAFVTEKEMEAMGTIKASSEEKEYLSEYDPVYIEFKDSQQGKVGDKFTIMRTEREIHHPITGDFVGYYTDILGVAQVMSVEDKITTAMISTSVKPIFRGDKVGPWMPELVKNIAPKANAVELRGYVVGSEIELNNLGESYLVFLDKGKQQGVEEGNVFDVVRREDALFVPGLSKVEGFWDKNMPMEIVGRIMVVDARDKASTGLVMASLKEIRVGDRVLMALQ